MKSRNERNSSYTLSLILGIISILSLTISIIFVCLYIKAEQEIKEVSTNQVASNPLQTVDFNEISSDEAVMGNGEDIVENGVTESDNESETDITDSSSLDETSTSGESSTLFSTFDNESFFTNLDQNSLREIRERMQSLVTAEDAGPMTMLRYFFPNNLIFYDSNTYMFADILENVAKHSYKASNFVVDDEGEISYVENGTTKSHKCIDVSKYQGEIDWDAVAADGVEYAVLRAGIRGYQSGEIVEDETFATNVEQANAAGVKTGVYFFTQAITEQEAKEEADFVLDMIKDIEVGGPVVFDVEMITSGTGRANSLTKEDRTKICIAFCDKIREAGYQPMIYGNIKCFVNMIDMEQLESYEKWYAFYDTYLYFPYELSMWQYTEKGHVDGIEGKVDMNVCFKEW